jgi:ribosome-associated protein
LENKPDSPQTDLNERTIPTWLAAVRAAESKHAESVCVLDLRDVTTFADYFVICSGTNPRQVQAIADEVNLELKRQGERAIAVEGYDSADWILIDCGDLLVHVFSETAREYYDLERLWRHATGVEIPPAPSPTPAPPPSS